MKSELGGDKIVRILTVYKELSPQWLLLGEGPMLKQHTSNDKNTETAPVSADNSTSNSRTTQAETSYIYKMYQDEKKDWKEEKKELKCQIELLQSELRQKSEELAALKAQYPQPQEKKPEPPTLLGLTDSFTDKSLRDYGKDYLSTKKSPSKKSSAGKI